MTIGRSNRALGRLAVALCVLGMIGWSAVARAQQVVSCRTLGTQSARTFDDVAPAASYAGAVGAVTSAGMMTACGGTFFCTNAPDSNASRG